MTIVKVYDIIILALKSRHSLFKQCIGSNIENEMVAFGKVVSFILRAENPCILYRGFSLYLLICKEYVNYSLKLLELIFRK